MMTSDMRQQQPKSIHGLFEKNYSMVYPRTDLTGKLDLDKIFDGKEK
jgi:hypothetical protein